METAIDWRAVQDDVRAMPLDELEQLEGDDLRAYLDARGAARMAPKDVLIAYRKFAAVLADEIGHKRTELRQTA